MGVIYGFAVPWANHHGPAGQPAGRRLNVETACLFLRAQASWLRQGLERAADPAAVGVVLGSHDTSHESWLCLIAAVESIDEDAATAVANLYAVHGRVVGSLERGFDRRLAPEVRAEMRRILSCHLADLTDRAVDALTRLDGTAEVADAKV